jgi:hypothetical protein
MEANKLDKLIEYLLSLPDVKAEIEENEERAKKEKWGKQEGDKFVPWSLQQSRCQAVYNYLIDGDLATVISNDNIFGEIQSYISSNTRIILFHQEKFLKERYKINGENMTNEALAKLYQLIENRINDKR